MRGGDIKMDNTQDPANPSGGVPGTAGGGQPVQPSGMPSMGEPVTPPLNTPIPPPPPMSATDTGMTTSSSMVGDTGPMSPQVGSGGVSSDPTMGTGTPGINIGGQSTGSVPDDTTSSGGENQSGGGMPPMGSGTPGM